jgi:DNA-directed RNA polymerase specialized sigma24 family protein
MLFFSAETAEELAMIAQKDPAIAEAVDLVMEFNEDEAERARADSWLLWQMDQAAREKYSKLEGLEEGRKEAARGMHKHGMGPEQIAEILELPLDTVFGYLQPQ